MSGEVVQFPSETPKAPQREPRRRPPEVQAEINRKTKISRECGREVDRLWHLLTQASEVRDAADALHKATLSAIRDVTQYLHDARDKLHLQKPPVA